MRVHPKLQAVLLGVGLALVLLLLLEVVGDVRDGAAATGSGTLLRLSLLVQALVGVGAAAGVWLGRRRDALVPLAAGLVLLWPALPALLPAVPSPPDWVPLLGGAGASGVVLVLVGALLGGAAISGR